MTEIAFIVDPIPSLNVAKDSTIAMFRAAILRNWKVWVMEQRDLYWENNEVLACVTPLEMHHEFMDRLDPSVLGDEPWYRFMGAKQKRSVMSFQTIFMRKDPPFDVNYIYTTYMLDRAEAQGVLVVNKPSSLRDFNEKFYATHFPEFTPPMVVAQDLESLKGFYFEHRDVVFKQLDGMGGKGIFRVREDDPNLNAVLETLTANGTSPIMGQKFLPEINAGDKRILIVDDETIPYALARVPPEGETRANLATGGTGIPQNLSQEDLEMANALATEFQKQGLLFVGIDVIGPYLTEINITCPTCIRELDKAYDLDIGSLLMDAVERHM
ncbi:MAG: glutathione synthase [Gammaproteobacteria bacterium]|nr:glutathione synthase [Gammaproteobacteria bacterium]MYF03018.1 glutathione synthase [Gammaproteobacteria bacterium]MYI77215.1 glutathione synthase [Gammaproteobacteria bacterium]